MRPAVLLPLLAACGRFGFDGDPEHSDASMTGDAGHGDGADAQPDAALLDCTMTHPSAAFCDGFESATMAPWDYTVLDFGSVGRVTDRAYRGTASLAATTDGSANVKDARWGKFLPTTLTSGDLYLRVYYWISSTTVVTDQLGILVTGNGAAPYPSSFVVLTPGKIALSSDGGYFEFAGEFPRDRWVCAELHVLIDPANGMVELTLDGTTRYTSTATDTAVAGGYTNFDIGVHYATAAQAAAQMWADEVVMDTSPIGCN